MGNEKIDVTFTDAELCALTKFLDTLSLGDVLGDSIYLTRGLRKIIDANEQINHD